MLHFFLFWKWRGKKIKEIFTIRNPLRGWLKTTGRDDNNKWPRVETRVFSNNFWLFSQGVVAGVSGGVFQNKGSPIWYSVSCRSAPKGVLRPVTGSLGRKLCRNIKVFWPEAKLCEKAPNIFSNCSHAPLLYIRSFLSGWWPVAPFFFWFKSKTLWCTEIDCLSSSFLLIISHKKIRLDPTTDTDDFFFLKEMQQVFICGDFGSNEFYWSALQYRGKKIRIGKKSMSNLRTIFCPSCKMSLVWRQVHMWNRVVLMLF